MIVFPFLCATFLVLTLVGEGTDRPILRVVAKPIASLCFVAAGLSGEILGSPYGIAVFAALILSLAGDVLLIPKDSRGCFLAGLGAFLSAHIAFSVGFLLTGQVSWTLAAGLVLPFGLLAVGVGRWLLPSVSDRMKVPVLAYIVVITVMVVLAWSCGTALLVAQVAATFFFLSDISVAKDRFRGGGFGNRLWGLPAYYLAQLLFVFSAS
jgi:uncharacterized membrane protein YhhN